MINKEKLEKLINETLKKESVLLAKPEDNKTINEEKDPEVQEDK